MIREVKFKDDVREGMRIGAKIVFEAVASTMGAKGKYVGIQNRFYENYATKDGYYTSKTIFLPDPVQNMGASMIKEVAKKSANGAGDGTTTSTVLTYKIFEKGLEAIKNGANAVDVKKGIAMASQAVIEELKANAIPLSGDNMLKQVATVSANNDEEIGGVIAEAMTKINPEGSVIVEESPNVGYNLEVVDGMRFDQGYLSNYFITNKEKQVCEMNDVFVLCYYGTLRTMQEVLPILEFAAEGQKSILIVALEIEQEAFQTLVVNKIGNETNPPMNISAVRVPGVGSTRQLWLEDIAVACGASVMSENGGSHITEFNPAFLGSAKKIKMDANTTTLVEGGALPSDLNTRVNTIKNQIDTAKKTDNVELYKDRLAKLIGGVSIIHVGATTEVELREKKDLFEDSIAATKSATEEGVLPGGGSSLVHAGKVLADLKVDNKDIYKGIQILASALSDPLLTIMGNAGVDSADILLSVVKSDDKSYGFDLNTEEYCDMIEAGILDTTKVERMAIENSASVASMMLMMETIIYSTEPNQ